MQEASLSSRSVDSTKRKPLCLGIDLGGTSVKFGLLNGDDLIARDQVLTAECDQPADAFRYGKQFLGSVLSQIGATEEDLDSVGLAMAGVIDESLATLKESANLHAWHGISFYRELKGVFNKPVAVINDANAAALGESAFGQQRSSSMALLTLGTGIGGGLIIAGKPVPGSHGCGGEIGHVPIDFSDHPRPCGCGRPGHLEAYCGAAGIVLTAKQQLSTSSETSLLRDVEILTPEAISHAAESGDRISRETIRRTGVYLGRAISVLSQIADPSLVLLGGAINFGGSRAEAGRLFLETIRSESVRLSLVQAGEGLEIDFATLGNDAGLLGAAHHARNQIVSA